MLPSCRNVYASGVEGTRITSACFGRLGEQETADVGTQVAAMKPFTELEGPDLVKVSFHYAAGGSGALSARQ